MTERKSHCYATCGGGSGVAALSIFFFNYLFIWKGKFPSHTLMPIFAIQGRIEDGREQKRGAHHF